MNLGTEITGDGRSHDDEFLSRIDGAWLIAQREQRTSS